MEAFLFFGAIAGVIWISVFARFFGLMGGCLLTLATGIVFGGEFYSVGPVHAGRLCLVGLIGAYVVARKLGMTETKRFTRMDILLGGFMLFIAVSTFAGDFKYEGYRPVTRLLFFNLLPLAMYWIARELKVSKQTMIGMFVAVACFGVYVSLTAVAEKFGAYALVFPRYIVNSANEEFLGRGRGPLLNPSANGILITAGWFALLMIWPHTKKTGRIAIGVISLVFAAGVFCTLTRCVWMGAFLGLAAIAWYTFPRRLTAFLAVAGMIMIIIAGPILIEKASRFKRDKNVSVEEMASSASLRPMLGYVAWQMFKDHPVTGVGFGRYKKFDKYYLSDTSSGMPIAKLRPYYQHNIFLSYLTELGLAGMLAYTGLFFGWLLYAHRLWNSSDAPLAVRQTGLWFVAFMISFMSNAMFQDVTIMTMINMVTFFFTGLLVGNYVRFCAEPDRQPAGVQTQSQENRIGEQPVAGDLVTAS